jgi:hypothetical protein
MKHVWQPSNNEPKNKADRSNGTYVTQRIESLPTLIQEEFGRFDNLARGSLLLYI